MATVQDVLNAIERFAPAKLAFPKDKIGLQVGNADQSVNRALVSLDRSLAAVEYAADAQAQLLLSHHPLIFEPIPSVTSDTYEGKTIQALIQGNISHVAAHTNWDSAPGGINDALAKMLSLHDVESFGWASERQELKLVTFAPPDAVERIIDACSEAGAGVIGNYRRCAFTSPGRGTFEPGEGSNPAIGEQGKRTTVEEICIEMICPADTKQRVSAALSEAHPYEEPAVDWVPLLSSSGQSIGRIGILEAPISLESFVSFVDEALATKCTAWGSPECTIERVAVVGGAADSEWRSAKAAGADVFITGEVKQHVAVEAAESEMALIAAGHYATEQPGCAELAKVMKKEVSEIDWLLFEPKPGQSGRPL